MNRYVSFFAAFVFLLMGAVMSFSVANAQTSHPIIEVVTLKLKQGVTYDAFRPVDKAVETEYASKQPGFLSRESAPGNNGEWLVIVHWRSLADADASMASFAKAPAAGTFMSMIDPSTMVMKRYGG